MGINIITESNSLVLNGSSPLPGEDYTTVRSTHSSTCATLGLKYVPVQRCSGPDCSSCDSGLLFLSSSNTILLRHAILHGHGIESEIRRQSSQRTGWYASLLVLLIPLTYSHVRKRRIRSSIMSSGFATSSQILVTQCFHIIITIR